MNSPPRPPRKTPASASNAWPVYRPEPDSVGAIPDLFAVVEVVTEHSLLERLKQLGADVYCEGEFATLTDRVRHVITCNQLATAISGRNPIGKVETVGQAFERVTGEPLVPKAAKRVARGTSDNLTSQTSKVTP